MDLDPALFEENERTAPTADARKFASVGPLELEVGGRLDDVTVAYETWGELSPEKDNAILVCHALSGDSHAIGWWERIVGPGRAIDKTRYFVVCSNALGGCQGTTGPTSTAPDGERWGARFPVVTVGDMVDAQARLADCLGVPAWAMVCGGSMGGMQALEWSRRYPDRVKRVWMTASCRAHNAMQIGFNEAGRQAILRDLEYRNGGQAENGLAVARMIGHLSYLSMASFEHKFGRRLQDKEAFAFDKGVEFQVESYLNYQGDKFTHRFDADAYLTLTRAIDYYDGSDVSAVTADFLLTSFTSDWIYPTSQSVELLNGLADVTKVNHYEIDLPYGHDSFLLDGDIQARFVQDFLRSG